MNTWLDAWDRRYTERVRLLVEILPVLAQEPNFALKGGTAINLFERDLPRLSVDIDLTWLPTRSFAEDTAAITQSLLRLADTLRSRPLQLQVQAPTGSMTRLVVSRARARVQIETTPVMRGAVHPVRQMTVRPRVEDAFGFASAQVLDFADLYAGKLAAALSRRHPRDLFDVGLLLEDERADQRLWTTFLVYLTSSPKPAWEMLAPGIPADFTATFDAHFKGMTTGPVSVEALLDTHKRLLARIANWLDEPSRAFLRSVENEQPDFDLIGLAHAVDLPGVRRKLHNLAQRTTAKRLQDRRHLEDVLERLI